MLSDVLLLVRLNGARADSFCYGIVTVRFLNMVIACGRSVDSTAFAACTFTASGCGSTGLQRVGIGASCALFADRYLLLSARVAVRSSFCATFCAELSHCHLVAWLCLLLLSRRAFTLLLCVSGCIVDR